MSDEFGLRHAHIVGEDDLVHEVQVVTLECHDVPDISVQIALLPDIDRREDDILLVCDRGESPYLAALGSLEDDDAWLTLLLWDIYPYLAVCTGSLDVDGGYRVSSWEVYLCYLVEVASEELQHSTTEHRAWAEGIELYLVSVLVCR